MMVWLLAMNAIERVMTSLKAIDRLAEDIAAAAISGSWVTRNGIENMLDFKGAYILALRLGETVNVELPKIVACQLRPGWYIYAGSAQGSGGIRARVRRHFQDRKKMHWHIDLLTANSLDIAALAVAGGHECEFVGKLLDSLQFKVAIRGFGNTDCQYCESHLLATCAS